MVLTRAAAIPLLTAAILLFTPPASAEVEVLLKSTTSWDGGRFVYPAGEAEITAVKVRLEEGQRTPFHCHPVPTMGYVLQGKLEVDTRSGERVTLEAGSAAIEVMDKEHRGAAVGGAVEILVFYAGAADLANTRAADDDGCTLD